MTWLCVCAPRRARRCRPNSASASRRISACDIIDGIGSTEMLHIFLSNRPGQVRYGTTGWPVPGYRDRTARRRRPAGARRRARRPLHPGPSSAHDVLGQPREVARDLPGRLDQERRQVCAQCRRAPTPTAGRSDDMLKVSGIYVSPFEVEATLVQHPAVLEAAVIGVPDAEGLTKTKAFVVLKPGLNASDDELKAFVKGRLAPINTRARSSSSPICRRPPPARSSASSCASARQPGNDRCWRRGLSAPGLTGANVAWPRNDRS